MQGDSIIIESQHRDAATGISDILLPLLTRTLAKHAITIAGESGSGKSEIAAALAELLEAKGIKTAILQQDDYFVYPPKSNDAARRKNIHWVGTGEVHLDQMDKHLQSFFTGKASLEKPLVIYADDQIIAETLNLKGVQVIIAEGTYTTLLENVQNRVFIDRNYQDNRKHRERRMRDKAELDTFIDNVLSIEHKIISSHRPHASIIINKDYTVDAT